MLTAKEGRVGARKQEKKVRGMTCMRLKLCSRYKYLGLLFILCLLCISRAEKKTS